MTPQEMLAAGQITPAQYAQMGISQGGWDAPPELAQQGLGQGGWTPPPGPVEPVMSSPPPNRSVAPVSTPAPPDGPPKPAFSPAAVDALYQAGKLTPEQYASMGGSLVPNGHAPISADIARQVAQAPSPQAPAAPTPKNLAVHPITDGPGAPGGQPGVASMQAPGVDPVAALLRPQAGVGAAHRVGMSPADAQMVKDLAASHAASQQTAAETAGALQAVASDSAKQNDAYLADLREGHQRHDEYLTENETHRKQLQDDARAAQGRIEGQIANLDAQGIDPNRYFQEQSTGQKILGAIAVGLGTFGAHALGPNGHDSANVAVDIMNNAIMRDVDAQKANLQKNMSVLGKRMELNHEGFDQQKAFLEAERESIQSGYAVTLNEIAKKAAMYQGNAEVQTKLATMTAGVKTAANQETDAVNEKLYSIRKGAERVVGGGAGNDIAKQIYERSVKIRDDAAAHGVAMTPDESHRQAVLDRLGVDVKPGSEVQSYATTPKGNAAAAAKAKEADEALARMTGLADEVKSTAYSPTRAIQGTEAFGNKNTQERWNSQVMGAVHRKYAARSPEAMKEIGAAYLIEPGDTKSTVERKTKAALMDLGGAEATDNNPAGGEKVDE